MNNAHMTSSGTPQSAGRFIGRRAILAAWVALSALNACDKSEPKKPVEAQASASITAAPPAASEKPVAPPAPADIDTAALAVDLKCAKAGPKQACRVVKEFTQAQRFTAQTPSGEGRWVGKAYTVENGVEKEREIILWAKRVPTAQVGPGDLPIKVTFEFFPDELKSHAEKLVRALQHSDAPSPKNQAFPYVKNLVPAQPRVIVNTAGQSVHVTAEQSIYIRANAPRTVYIVNPSSAQRAGSGDGMYAELWLADW